MYDDWNEKNPYYSPGKMGLELLGSLEDPGACYDFNTIIVLKDADGNFLWDMDSGCSCPTPFENSDPRLLVDSREWDRFREAVDGHPASEEDKIRFLRLVGR